jgi:hypothetical protein
MGTSLNGTTPSVSYTGLLKFGDNTEITSSLKAISDGAGNDTMLELSTTALQIGGSTGAFWDNTNKRLGVGTNTPTASIEATTFKSSSINDNGTVLQLTPSYNTYTLNKFSIGSGDMPARLGIKGSGTTSATTSLLVQNSAGTNWLQVKDDGDITNGANGSTDLKFEISPVANKFFRLRRQSVNVDFYAGSSGNAGIEVSGGAPFNITAGSANLNLSNGGVRVGSSYATTDATAQLEIVSTTKGFLPPRMTTTQKNAISSPASGLMVYDTDTNKLCCYNGTSWNDLF